MSNSVQLKKSASNASLASGKTANLASKHINSPQQLQFPNNGTYYVYKPAGPNSTLLERFISLVSLYYYKYLLHTGLYVMTTNEQRIINTIVVVSVILSLNQFIQLVKKFFP